MGDTGCDHVWRGAERNAVGTFTPTDATDYTSATSTVTLTVNQATPTISWSNPVAISYGTHLSGTQLNATASVPGALTYTPASGALLTAGEALLVRVDPDLDRLRAAAAAAGVEAAALDAFFGQFSGASAPG